MIEYLSDESKQRCQKNFQSIFDHRVTPACRDKAMVFNPNIGKNIF
jgi:hypothetical protein